MSKVSRKGRIVIKALWMEKNCSSRRFLKEFVSESWSRVSLDRLIKKVDAGLPTDRIIGQGRHRSLKVIMHQTRTSRLHVAPPSVLHFH